MLSQITDCFAKIFLIIYVICLIQSLKDHYCKSSFGISTISLPQKVFVLSAILKEHDTLIFNTMIFELILKPGKHVLTYTSQVRAGALLSGIVLAAVLYGLYRENKKNRVGGNK